MREQIKKVLKNLGTEQVFYIGYGAKHKKSGIHFRIDKKTANLQNKGFAIQFEKESKVVAIWDIRDRIRINASLDLYVKDSMVWENVNKIYVQEIAISKRNSGTMSKLALMLMDQFEDFLKFNKLFGFEIDIDNKEFDDDDIQSINISGTITEGRVITYYGKRYERNPQLRDAAIKIHGYTCKICGFNYMEYYGEIGKDYIEIHHIKPLNVGEQSPNPKTDMISVCASCHRMLHRNKSETLTPEKLKNIISSKKD